MNTIPTLFATFQPVAKALKGLSKHLPTRKNRADRRALKLRRDLVKQLKKLTTRPDWSIRLPERVNQPAFVVTPNGLVRVLHRSLDARSGKYRFTLRHRRPAREKGFALMCRDQVKGCTYVLLASSRDDMPYPYLSVTVEEAQAHAVAVLPLAG